MKIISTTLALSLALSLGACGGNEANHGTLVGTVRLDGSSTVFPISEAIAEEYREVESRVRVTVGVSGTGGGFKKFCAGEIDISDASRAIRTSEMDAARKHGVEYIEIPVAFDGLAVVVNPKNHFVDHLTVEELKRIWQPGSTVTTWQDVRPSWPARKIRLYGPGTDSGTFDYFTKAIVGKARACRPDFTASEDDNILVRGISGDLDGLAYFGLAYYAENATRLKLVPIDGGSGPIAPSAKTVNDGTYAPLSRPIFIYVRERACGRPEVDSFVRFYISNAGSIAADVGYVALPKKAYEFAARRYEARRTGSLFGSDQHAGKSLIDTLSADI